MHLEFMRDAAKMFPAVSNPAEIESLCVWHCKYQTLTPLAAVRHLRTLKIAPFPDDSLERLAGHRSHEASHRQPQMATALWQAHGPCGAGVWQHSHNKRLDRFTLRGQIKVNTQWHSYCLVHNIEKLAHHGYAQ